MEAKIEYAKKRLESEGWEMAMHSTTLEVLGYRKNRAAMARVAQLLKPSLWRTGSVPVEEAAWSRRQSLGKNWSEARSRPELRIAQYRKLWISNPQWLDDLRSELWPRNSAEETLRSRIFSDTVRPRALRKRIETSTLRSSITGTRLDTLIVDAWLPLITVMGNADYSACWVAWYPGDFPESFTPANAQAPASPVAQ